MIPEGSADAVTGYDAFRQRQDPERVAAANYIKDDFWPRYDDEEEHWGQILSSYLFDSVTGELQDGQTSQQQAQSRLQLLALVTQRAQALQQPKHQGINL